MIGERVSIHYRSVAIMNRRTFFGTALSSALIPTTIKAQAGLPLGSKPAAPVPERASMTDPSITRERWTEIGFVPFVWLEHPRNSDPRFRTGAEIVLLDVGQFMTIRVDIGKHCLGLTNYDEIADLKEFIGWMASGEDCSYLLDELDRQIPTYWWSAARLEFEGGENPVLRVVRGTHCYGAVTGQALRLFIECANFRLNDPRFAFTPDEEQEPV